MTEILEQIRSRSCKVTDKDFHSGEYQDFIDNGLLALILCLGGVGTSTTTSIYITNEKNRPTCYLEGGLYRLYSMIMVGSDRGNVARLLKTTPVITFLVSKSYLEESLAEIPKTIGDRKNVIYEPSVPKAKIATLSALANL